MSYLVALAASEPMLERGQEVVVLASVLCHRSNLGYEHLANLHLKSFNDIEVTSLSHLNHLLDVSTEKFFRFEFSPSGNVVIIDKASAKTATAEVCKENAVPGPLRLRK